MGKKRCKLEADHPQIVASRQEGAGSESAALATSPRCVPTGWIEYYTVLSDSTDNHQLCL